MHTPAMHVHPAASERLHVAFACMDMSGHLMPLLPFMAELLERGHDVTAFVHNDPKYVKMLRSFGLEAVRVVQVDLNPIGDMGTEGSGARRPGLCAMLAGGGPLAYHARPLFDAIVQDSSMLPSPNVVVADFFTSAALDAGDALGVPAVVVFPNPLGMTSLVAPRLRGVSGSAHALACRAAEAVLARLLLLLRNRERRVRGLRPMAEQDLYPCDTMARPFLCTTAIGYEYPFPQPPLAHFVGPTAPRQFAPVDGPLGAWLGEAEARSEDVVFVAFGTMHVFSERGARELLASLEAVAAAGSARVLWALPAKQQGLLGAGALERSRVRVEPFVPQAAVLRHASTRCFVSHCGANSVAEALLAGTPLVCCPQMADQPANAARVVSSGCGVLARGRGGVEKACLEVLRDRTQFEAALARMGAVIAGAGGAGRGVDVIELVARTGYAHLSNGRARASWLRRAAATMLIAIGIGVAARWGATQGRNI